VPSDVARLALSAAALSLLCFGAACPDDAPAQKPTSRFAAVTKDKAPKKAARSFCETTYPASGAGALAYAEPPGRPTPGPAGKTAANPKWRWVNLWATWCKPCVEELPLLDKWQKTLASDGIPVGVELWSIDEEESALKDWLNKTEMPGRVKWLKSAEDLGPTLQSFGVDKNSAIPIHLLVDSTDHIRCVRVGAVHEEDYGAIKTILAGG
jgi:thiol-disulfide isomerase/thioredoxin